MIQCPFCKSDDIHYRADRYNGWIECFNCGCQGPHVVWTPTAEENAIAAWNRRAGEQATVEVKTEYGVKE